jgi:hypothetical protein
MSLRTEHVARRRYLCGWDCGEPIEPGTRYIRSVIPPWTEPNESPHWWTHRLHGPKYGDCPSRQKKAQPEESQ